MTNSWKDPVVREKRRVREASPETKKKRSNASHESNNRPEVVAKKKETWERKRKEKRAEKLGLGTSLEGLLFVD